MDVWEEMGKTGWHPWNKGLRLEESTNIWQDLQEESRAGGQEANSWNFH
jgi:hypothetical protein